MKPRLLQTTIAALFALGLSALAAADTRNILMIAGRPSHGPAQHEHNAGVQLLAKCLRESGLPLDVKFHLNGEWPSPEELAKADTIVIYADGGGGHPALQGDRLQQLDREMKRGAGLVCLHYAVEPTTEKGNKEFIEWLGGCFETHWSVNPHWDAEFKSLPQHAISNGVKPFSTNDEWYFHMRFRRDMKGVTPILTAIAPDSTMARPDGTHSGNPAVREDVKNKVPQHVAWAVQRDDGGRGFGFTGGHFHMGWGNNDQRKLVLNAILWTAKGDVPADGVKSSVTEADLKANLDPKPGQGLPEKKKPKLKPALEASAAGGAGPVFEREVAKATGAVDVRVDLKGAKSLYLVVHQGPDSLAADWTDWVEPMLTYKDGTKQKVTDLKWKQATSGFGGVVINKNCTGGEMHIEGLPDGKAGRLLGIGTHANSLVAFDLPDGAERFEAKVGLDKGGTDQGVDNRIIARVYTAEPGAAALAANPSGGGASDKPHGFEAAREQMRNFKVSAGLAASLFAAEPEVQNPTNIDIDPRGRVWVLESVNYRKWGNPPLRPEGDRITILESTKGDGVADRETTFWQNPDLKNGLGLCVLPNPNGPGTRVIASYGGRISLLTDADGDDKAEKVETLLQAEGAWDHDHHVHAVSFGSDGKFYFNMGNAGTALQHADGSPVTDLQGHRVAGDGKPYRQGMIFRCDIDLEHATVRNVETLAHNFRNNYEVAVDSFGGLWQSDNDDDGNKGVRINNIIDYGSYGYTDEMTGAGWKTVRTNLETEIPLQHWHQNDPGTIPNLLQTGQGSPTGICVNEGAILGRRFQNQVIHCDAGPRTVRAYPVGKNGAGFTAEMVDILTTDDTWYRPSDCCIAPDGSLFVADWYDPGVGGHAMGDNDAAKVRGRLYRVAPEKLAYKIAAPDFSTADGLAKALCSPNLSTRYVAFSKLRAMGAEAGDALAAIASSANPRYRARALHLLARIPGRFQSQIEKALADDNADIRATAVRELRLAAARRNLPTGIERNFSAYLLPFIKAEPDRQVLREFALALHIAPDPAKEMPSSAGTPGPAKAGGKPTEPEPADSFAAAWVALARKHDGKDRWYLEALGIGAAGRDDRAFRAWLGAIDAWNTPAGRDIVWRLRTPLAFDRLTEILTDKKADEALLPRYLREFDFLPDGDAKNSALIRIANANTGRLAIEIDVLQRIAHAGLKDNPDVKEALNATLAAAKGKPAGLQLVQSFGLTDRMSELIEDAIAGPADSRARDAVKFLFAQRQEGMKLLRAALATPKAEKLIALLGGSTDRQAIALLAGVVASDRQPAPIRTAAVKALTLTFSGAQELLALAESGKLPVELKPAAQSALAMVQYPGISDRIARTLPAPQSAGGKTLPPIGQLVKMNGDPVKGGAVFAKAESSCTLCHRAGKLGADFAPALSEIGSKLGKDAIYDSIINPNAGISMGFETTELKLKGGGSALGIVRSETGDQLVLALPGGVTNTFRKDQVAERKKLPVSMMPTGLQALFSGEDLVNLVEYLYSLKSPHGKVAAQK